MAVVCGLYALVCDSRLVAPRRLQELEDILETYFAQLDRTCSRLRALDEHVSQTEDFVNIDLARRSECLLACCAAFADAASYRQDSKRNMLIEIMMVTAFVSLAILMYTTETGLFGACQRLSRPPRALPGSRARRAQP